MFFTLRVSSPRSGYAQPSVGYILLTKISFQHDVHTPSHRRDYGEPKGQV